MGQPEDPNGPDELLPEAEPNTRVVPFHYDHPVTGEKWEGDIHGKPVPAE